MKKEFFVEVGKIVENGDYRTEDKALTTISCANFTNARDVAVNLYCGMADSANVNPAFGVDDLYTKKRVRFSDTYIAIKSKVIWGE